MNKQSDVVVIGAGLSGIACALRLKAKGKSVVLIEKNGKPGGKLDEFEDNGFRFDKGPSLFTEPNLIDELFELYGKNPRDYFNYKRHNESCRYYFPDGTHIVLYDDKEKTLEEMQKVFSAEDVTAFGAYLTEIEKSYNGIGKFFLDNPKPELKDTIKWSFIKRYPLFLKKKMRVSLDNYNASKFKDQRLINLFNKFGTYNGSNPYEMSGLYSMISNLELNKGTFFPEGGMRAIVTSLTKLCDEVGVEIVYNEEVSVKATSGTYSLVGKNEYTCQQLVSAIDHLTFYDKVLVDKELFTKYVKKERSTSGLALYVGIDQRIPALGLHNILFSTDYKKEFDELFIDRKLASNPTVYIHVSSEVNQSDAPENGQNLFALIHTTAYQAPDKAFVETMKTHLIKRINDYFGVDITDHIVNFDFWSNNEIETLTGSYMGAIYGGTSNKLTAALTAHPNHSNKYPNLYFCGGTVHPGGGMPLVLRSAKIVADKIS